MTKIIKKIIRESSAVIFILGSVFFPGCGGGTRGTGDLTIEGKVLTNTGSPVKGVSVTFTKTGDVANTDSNGNFLLRTHAVDDQTEFLIETNNIQLISQGARISKDVENIAVTITISNIDSSNPTTSQDVSIKKRRGGNNRGNQQDEENDSSDDSKSGNKDKGTNNGGKSPDLGEREDSDGDNDDSSSGSNNTGNTADEDDKNSSSHNSNDDDNQHPDDEDHHDQSTPSPTHTPDSVDNEDVKVEKKGSVTSINSNQISVGGTNFIVNGATEFKGFSSLAQIDIGDSVEIKGYERSATIFAEEIKKL